MSVNMSGTRREMCQTCNGTGNVFNNTVWNFGVKPCPDCKGTGYIEIRPPPEQFKLPRKRRI